MDDLLNKAEKFLLLSTLGQMLNLRVWIPRKNISIPMTSFFSIISYEDHYILQLTDLEIDLFPKLAHTCLILEKLEIFDEIEIEADFEDYYDAENFSVLLDKGGNLLLLYTTCYDKSKMKEKLMVEWMKRLIHPKVYLEI
ncbi:MAG: hypothetical protein OEY49_03560 [Candidatus Heimdallarchaeota archaeon]|nr:hypothetical protein [Candidatus Heimdallarchaeota archaeon]